MKRVITFALALFLLFPSCFAEEINETLYTGTWVYQEETSNGGFLLEVLHLTKEHKVFYIRQFYDAKTPTYNWKTVGSWQISENGIRINTGEGYPEYYTAKLPSVYLPLLYLYYPSGAEYKIFEAISSDMLTRIADDSLSNIKEETGVFVPSGYWDVGIDIPAGIYSVRKPDNINSQNFVVYERYNEETGRYTRALVNTILNSNNSIIGKITLREGNVVWVDEGVYFDTPISLGF